MPCLFEWIALIPDVIWSGVIASLLTLSGVLISNRSNTNRLRIQLDHDSNEKKRERNAVLRKEVYLETVEELTKAHAHLGNLAQLDPEKENLGDGMQGFFSSAAKLQLVAESSTALLVNELVGKYGSFLMRAIARAIPLHQARAQIKIEDHLYDQAQSQVIRVLGEMTKFNESAQSDEGVFNALYRSYEGFQKQAETHANLRHQAWEDFNHRVAPFSIWLISELMKIGHEQIVVIVEVRRDLGLTTDLDVFRAQMEEQWQKMSSELEAMLHDLKAA